MANIGFDNRARNDENSTDVPLRSKQIGLNVARSAKKQAFGDLKNRMQNQQVGSTPLKGNAAKIDGLPLKFGGTGSLCNDLLRKQQQKQNFLEAQKKIEQQYKKCVAAETYKEPVFDEEVFDSWDFDRKCCSHQKREEEIWAEMDMLKLNFNSFSFQSENDKDEEETEYKFPDLFDDFDDALSPPRDFMSQFENSVDYGLPTVLDDLEDFSFEI